MLILGDFGVAVPIARLFRTDRSELDRSKIAIFAGSLSHWRLQRKIQSLTEVSVMHASESGGYV
jgi:hypothetical protein